MPFKHNVSGTWKDIVVWHNVAGTWKKVALHQNVSGVWKKITSLLASLLPSTITGGHLTVSPTDANCVLTLSSAGTWTCTGTAGGTWQEGGAAGDYEARWTTTSGTLTSGTAGTWQALSTSRSWTKTNTNNSLSSVSVTGTLEVRMAAAPNTVLSTTTVTLTASVEL